MYLLDTVVLSELRKRSRTPSVVAWISSVPPEEMFLSVISVAEIEFGIERQRAVDAAFADHLSRWLEETIHLYDDRVLPVTSSIARRWGRLGAHLGNKNLDFGIAATALEHGLTVVTRNISHFETSGAAIMN